MSLERTGELVWHSLDVYIDAKLASLAVMKTQMRQQEEEAANSAKGITTDVMAKMSEALKALSVEREALSRRRVDFLESLSNRLEELKSSIPKSDLSLTEDMINSLQSKADAIFDSDQADMYSRTHLNVSPILTQLMEMQTEQMFGMAPAIQAHHLMLKVVHKNPNKDTEKVDNEEETNSSDVWLLVVLQGHEGVDISSVLSLLLPFLELCQTFQMKSAMVLTSFEEFHNRNVLQFPDQKTIALHCPLSKVVMDDVIVSVRFHDKEIKGSPKALSVRCNESFRVDKLPELLRNIQLREDEDEELGRQREDERSEKSVIIIKEIERKEEGFNYPNGVMSSNANGAFSFGNGSVKVEQGEVGSRCITSESEEVDKTEEGNEENNETVAKHWRTLHSELSKTIVERIDAIDDLDDSDLHSISIRNSPRQALKIQKQLPLDHPSPHNNHHNAMLRTKAAVHSPKTFAPDQASTMGVDAIRSVASQLINGNEDDGDENNHKDVDNNDEDVVDRMQELLAGDVANLNVSKRGTNKNVSFHEATSVYYQKSLSSNGSSKRCSKKMNRDSNDGSNSAYGLGVADSPAKVGYEVAVGRTKEADGSQQLFKGLLRAQRRSMANQSMRSDPSVTSNISLDDEDFCFSDIMSDVTTAQMDCEENWELSSDKFVEEQPQFDFSFSDRKYAFGLIHSLRVPGVPQSVSLMADKEVLLVSDVKCNNILVFKTGLIPKRGIWSTEASFHLPRYVVCSSNPSQVFVLDNKALHFFNSSNVRKPRKLFVNRTSNMRGLAWFSTHGRVVTSIVEEDVGGAKTSYVAFVDVHNTRDIVHKIRLPIEACDAASSRVRFLTCSRSHVFCSDLGLGRIYSVDVIENTAQTWADDARLRNGFIMGLTCDPAGNVLVAGNADGLLHVFSPTGHFIRSLRLPNLQAPAGIELQGRNLFVADCKGKCLLVYNVVQLGT